LSWKGEKSSLQFAVGEANATKPRTTPTAASAGIGNSERTGKANTNKGENKF